MLKTRFEVVIARAPIDVYRVLSNHENDVTWQSIVTAVRKLSTGPVRAGSRFVHTLHLLGARMDAEVEVAETRPGELHVFSVSNGSLAFETRVALETSAAGTRVRTAVDAHLSGAARLAAISLSHLRRREIDGDLRRLKHLMEARAL